VRRAAIDSDVLCISASFRNCSVFGDCGSFLIDRGGSEAGNWGGESVAFFRECEFMGSHSTQFPGAIGNV
jgi:hypothetical protein